MFMLWLLSAWIILHLLCNLVSEKVIAFVSHSTDWDVFPACIVKHLAY
jgi:hypothetical protein